MVSPHLNQLCQFRITKGVACLLPLIFISFFTLFVLFHYDISNSIVRYFPEDEEIIVDLSQDFILEEVVDAFVKENIWNVSETFLQTPFFNTNQRFVCRNGIKFRKFRSLYNASEEIYNMTKQKLLKSEDYYISVENHTCLLEGTDLVESIKMKECVCLNESLATKVQFQGPRCDVPMSVWALHTGAEFPLRQTGRRIVMGLVVDHELEMTEIRIRQLYNLVDIFVILESNITAGGDSKPLYFFNAFRRGYLCDFQDKILYSFLDVIPEEFIKDGWLADNYLRDEMSRSSLRRISDLDPDDLFLSFDADEIPNEEVLFFLMFHDGYANPITLSYRWTIYKYFWESFAGEKLMTTIPIGSTVDFLREVCDGKVIDIRKRYCIQNGLKWQQYKGPKSLDSFEIGVHGNFAGHHCSWCSTPEGIAIKLLSAIHQDFPRWGDDPSKVETSYINNLIQTGKWFDGSSKVIYTQFSPDDNSFAPHFVLKNSLKYSHLLERASNSTK